MKSIQIAPPRNSLAQGMARGLGWFSIVLGVCEVLAPGAIKHSTGSPGPRALLRAYGVREILAGAAILKSDTPVSMTWMRVAGDLVDIATLVPALSRRNPHQRGGQGAMAFVALATALDLYVAMQGDRRRLF